MHFYLFGAMAFFGLLSACGGSSTSGNETARFTTLKTFSDGAGIARGVTSSGKEALYVTGSVQSVVASANANPNLDPDDPFKNLPVTGRADYGDIRSGTVTIEGTAVYAVIIEDDGGDAKLLYANVGGEVDMLGATGSAYGSAPNGTYSYKGTHVIGDRYNGGSEIGTFTMSANFNNKTFSYTGATTSSALSGSGAINTASGRFRSNNMAYRVQATDNDSGTATLYGQFHGSSAQSTSGVFNTNEADPYYAGGFAGSR